MTNTLVIWNGVLVMSEHVGRQAARQSLAQKILLGSGIFGGFVGAGSAMLKDMGVTLPAPLVFGATLTAIVALFWVSIIYWRNIDEAARAAHTFAWFWGGAGGMLAILPIGLVVSTERLVAMFGQRDPLEWATLGFVSLLTAQLVGYGLVWVGWWLRQR